MIDVSNTTFAAGYLLTEPRVVVKLDFKEPLQSQFYSGVVAVAHIEAEPDTLAAYLWGRSKGWLQKAIKQYHNL